VKTPYSEEKDIAFYTAPDGERMIATPDNFFIFFPDDAHMPGMKVDQNAPVRKVVLKVKND
jgi:YhcH/YjgK/YiaL family protein